MNQPALERALLSTLVYYKPLHLYALTPLELMRYLTLTPQDRVPNSTVSISLKETLEALNNLLLQGKINQSNGYFFLAESPADSYWQRIRARNNSVEKRQIFKRIARFYPHIPFVRAVILAGSVARDSSVPDSDIDVFVISSPGHVWLTRFLVGTFTWVMGKYRHKTHICDQICLNYYLSIDSANDTRLDPVTLSTAHIYAAVTPYWGKDIFEKIIEANKWMNDYMPLIKSHRLPALELKPAGLSMHIKSVIEYITIFAGLDVILERSARYIQRVLILHNVDGKSLEPAQIIINDNNINFHLSRSQFLEDSFYSAIKNV